MARHALVAGNWKMNGTRAAMAEFAAISAAIGTPNCDVLICPPATLLAAMAAQRGNIMLGGQTCHEAATGAHTGDISAEMLADAGASAVILGHSERRADHGETSQSVAAKARAAWRAGLIAVVCVGETEAQRKAGAALETVGAQLAASLPDGADATTLVIAYEPVWAIGTGLVPTLADIGEMHAFMRDRLTGRFGAEVAQGVRLLYGGSVKPTNAAEIFAVNDVDGALVGGASLGASQFAPIVAAI